MVSAYALSAALSLLSFSLGVALTWPLLGHAPQAGDALAAYKLGLAASALLFALCALPLLGVRERRAAASGRPSLKVSLTALKLAGLAALMGFGAGLGVWNVGYWFARKHGAEAPQLGALSIASNVLIAVSATAAPAVSAKLGAGRGRSAGRVNTVPRGDGPLELARLG